MAGMARLSDRAVHTLKVRLNDRKLATWKNVEFPCTIGANNPKGEPGSKPVAW
jgi:hypothetical protein